MNAKRLIALVLGTLIQLPVSAATPRMADEPAGHNTQVGWADIISAAGPVGIAKLSDGISQCGDVGLSDKPKELTAVPGTGVVAALAKLQLGGNNNLNSKQKFGDCELHLEFLIGKGCNSGVKLQGRYEIQLYDSHDREKPTAKECGGIYPHWLLQGPGKPLKYIDEGVPPKLNAAKPAGEWQTLDIMFQAPRFDANGKKTQNATFVSVVLNGKTIHENVELDSPTGNASTPKPEVAEGPLFMQLDHGAVAFRNVRVKPAKTMTAAKPAKRNFVFILVDDLGCRDLGFEGSKFHETPNIDRLAASGMRFDQGYAACQVCSPSRASIMLGKATPRHGITDWIGAAHGMKWNRDDRVLPAEYVHNLPHEDTTLAEAFRDGGYSTFFAGKWHLGTKGSWPEDHGFMINKGGWDVGSPKGGFFSPWQNPRLESGPNGESLTLRLANETASFIESNQDKPFLAYLSFYTVHGPIQTTEELCNKYRDKAAEMGLTENDQRFQFRRRLPVRMVQDNPIYAGMVETLDTAVGIVMNKLKETGLDKNTVVIFTSDNGGVSSGDAFSTSLLPFRGGKGMQWEGGIREPYIIHVPGMTTPGSSTQTPAIGMDFYPTMLELAGLPAKPEQHVDGVSLVPVLKGETIPERELFWHYPHYGNQGGEPSSIIRSKDWKLIYYHEDGRSELYDLSKDIGEEHNVASQNSDTVAALKLQLDAWLADTGAKIPKPDPRFDQGKFDKRVQNSREVRMRKLEKQHAEFLDKNKKPSPNWWGSAKD